MSILPRRGGSKGFGENKSAIVCLEKFKAKLLTYNKYYIIFITNSGVLKRCSHKRKRKGFDTMKKWECKVCGYIYEGDEAPERCPVCGASKDQFVLLTDGNGVTEKNLSGNWDGETEEAGLYFAFAKKAEEEGYPEVAQAFAKIAIEEAWHAAEIVAIQGKVKSTKENLAWRVEAELGAQKGKAEAAEHARKDGNLAAAEFFERASKDEGRHAAAFKGLLDRLFK